MDKDYRVRKQVTLEQLNALVEFLKEHEELARGLARGRRGKLHTLKQWNLCAKNLNEIKDGATKDGRAWSKYWCDWKYRVKRRALELRVAKENNKCPPEGIPPLSSMEEDILSIIGEGAVDNVIIKNDPLAEGPEESHPVVSEEPLTRSNFYEPISDPVKTTSDRKRRHSSTELSEAEDSNGPSSAPEPKSQTSSSNNHKQEDDTTTNMFLQLEKKKLNNDRKLYSTVRALTMQITKLTEVISHIRDVLVNKI